MPVEAEPRAVLGIVLIEDSIPFCHSAISLSIFTLPLYILMSLKSVQIYYARFSPQGNSMNDVVIMWMNLAH